MSSGRKIPYELHLTTAPLSVADRDHFTAFCRQHELKPLLILLARGLSIQQPMASKVFWCTSPDEALTRATRLTHLLNDNHFQVTRCKIEIPADEAGSWMKESSSFDPYYEWHGKISGSPSSGLMELCLEHKAHLSVNAFNDKGDIRFVTLREFATAIDFKQRIGVLAEALIRGGWPLLKEVSEFCIYDNNIYLDKGWLPQ